MEEIVIKVDISVPTIKSNFSVAKLALEKKLKQYDLIVDVESIKIAKAMATDINKMKSQIAKKRKEVVSLMSEPLKEFEEEAKNLEKLCEASRQKLQEQIKVFEDEKRTECLSRLKAELEINYSHLEIRDEFKTIKVDDLAIVSNMTKTGIAKKAYTEIESRVLEIKRFQEKIDKRLLTLEGTCFKAGLQAPLTRENIAHFLMDGDDDVYEKKLHSLISNEITRIDLMNERIKEKKSELSQQKKYALPVKEIKKELPQQYAHFKNSQFVKTKDKSSYTVTAVFEVEASENVAAKLDEILIKKFKKAGFKTLPAIYVEKS